MLKYLILTGKEKQCQINFNNVRQATLYRNWVLAIPEADNIKHQQPGLYDSISIAHSDGVLNIVKIK